MRVFKYFLVVGLVGILALPALGARKTAQKDAGVLIRQVKIELHATPPRLETALEYLDTVLTQHGPYPEAYFFRGNIYGEFANKEYDLKKRLDNLTRMAADYDSLNLTCSGEIEVERKLTKKCKDYIKNTDSIRVYYWRDNYNNAVGMFPRIDDQYIPNVSNAADSAAKEAAEAVLKAAADSSRYYFLAAVASQPDDYRAYRGLGVLYGRLEEYDSSKAWYIKAHQMAPDSSELMHQVAYAYIRTETYDSSVIWYGKVLKRNSADFTALTNTAYCYNKLQIPESSLVYNLRAIKADPSDADLYFDVGQYYLGRSMEYSEKIGDIQTKGDKADASEKEEKANMEKLREAVFDSCSVYFGKCIELDSNNVNALGNYGIVKMLLADYTSAEIVFRRLTELQPMIKENWIDLGDICVKLERFEDAVGPYEKATELDPGDERLWEVLADLYQSNGMTEKADEARAKAEELRNL
jgi:tetratricopeptide (TPR) repeat protein